ncbi:MAG: arginase family protein [Alphaproteobacteria bacterium]|nr:arginase family protein [Alphaproteobacteria bacterium]
MTNFIGIEYGRGATAKIVEGGPALAPAAVKEMFPSGRWTIISAAPVSADECMADRFGENFEIQKQIYAATPAERHIFIGGDHSVNFGHFTALADKMPDEDLCLVYIDAHLDIHTPESSQAEASGAPHGTNVRANLGQGDARWLSLQKKFPALRPENLFYLASRSYEPSEISFVRENNIFMRSASELQTDGELDDAIAEIRRRIDGRPFVVSFDFDAIDPIYFKDVLVPESGGISMYAARRLTREFADAHSFEFVEYAPSGDETAAAAVRELVGIAADYR